MYGRSDGFSPGQLVLAVLALVGLGYLVMQVLGPDQDPRLSAWGAQANGAPPAAEGGLSGAAAPQQGRGLPGSAAPQGNPLQAANTVMTQGYGVGSHAPAETWGAIDLAIDSDGDGAADPKGTWEHPVYATQRGVVRATPNSWPAGNHVWVENEAYRTGFAHLSRIAAEDGQTVEPGDLLGYIGSTGMSSGPHLDYQVWEKQSGAWVNQNPLGYGALDGAN